MYFIGFYHLKKLLGNILTSVSPGACSYLFFSVADIIFFFIDILFNFFIVDV